MSILPKASPALPAKSKESQQIALFYAVVLVGMAVAQLFSFEDFIKLVPAFNLPLGGLWPYAVAPLLVTAEVFALPFLLRMALSPAFRVVSMGMGWIVAGGWFLVSLWIVSTSQPVDTIGFFGTTVNLMPGWWAVYLSVAMGILAAWASWGLWPIKRRASKTKK
jgi:predicted lysophospholipase L1 biosynthesis ABC-type transport system permease subunit